MVVFRGVQPNLPNRIVDEKSGYFYIYFFPTEPSDARSVFFGKLLIKLDIANGRILSG